MSKIDYVVMAIFAVLILSIGMAFTRKGSKSSSSFFEAGGETPWWINGLSLFISYFSAGTFVVWGSIAYKYGLVSNGIQISMALAGFFVAIFIAGKWKKIGAVTAAEYIGKRFGVKPQQFYTILIMLYSLFSTAAVLYPVGKMVNVVTGLPINACILVIGAIIILYTAAGGLWAVLVTDVVQFVILTAAVFIVIPLAIQHVGGMQNFTSKAPPDFFNFLNSEYSIGFFLAFTAYQTVYIGGNWAYVQRYTSVSSVPNARKVAYLFTGLYLISPFIWMLPPMIYRVLNPNLTGLQAEGAYMLICQQVLPAGLIGLVLSGMVSATASKANTTINLVAVVFAHDVYKKIIRPGASEKNLIAAARFFTVLFGTLTILIAMMVPLVGGIVEMVLSTASIAGGALFAPIIWSLYSKKQTASSIVLASLAGLIISLFFKLLAPGLLGIKLSRVWETALGVCIPLIILAVTELVNKAQPVPLEIASFDQSDKSQTKTSSGEIHEQAQQQNIFGIKVIAISIGIVGVGVFILGTIAHQGSVAMIVGGIIAMAFLPIWRAAIKIQKSII
ncbi:sodium:solute symporter family protein [Mucilaginibacter sp.]|jgi:SSS family transporter|uniref:sodium:solute symporter family protein n=1 Tax=Mucilaginibacter sp. TaxID=1882438 RepID=UPI003564F36D